MKIGEVLKYLNDEGWQLRRKRDDRQEFRHSGKRGWITIIGLPSDEIKRTTMVDKRGSGPKDYLGGHYSDVILVGESAASLAAALPYHTRYRRKV